MSDSALRALYLDPKSPTGFTGKYRLLQAAKEQGIPESDVEAFLSKQIAYTKHFPRRNKFRRHFYNIVKYGHLLESDLWQLSKELSEANKVKFIMIAIEGLSRKIFAVPMKDKSAKSTAAALEKILKAAPPIELLRSDAGKEYCNSSVRALLEKRNIIHKITGHTTKASLAERALQTIARRVGRYLTFKNTYRFVDVLPDIVEGYNNSKHSTTQYAPNEVGKQHEFDIFQRVFLKHNKDLKKRSEPRAPVFKLGDTVRLVESDDLMKKGYRGSYTDEAFKISAIRRTNPVTYHLKDLQGEDILSEMYGHELVRVQLPAEEDAHEISRILGRRKKDGKVQLKVSWRNYPANYTTYIDKDQLEPR